MIIYDETKKDIGFCGQDEFASIYADATLYDARTIDYIDPAHLDKGNKIDAVKCSTGEFCIVPQGTLIQTNEGEVRVAPGNVLIVNEKKNSIYVQDIEEILKRYIADPFNPVSKQAFNLMQTYIESKSAQGNVEAYAELVKKFSALDTSQRLQAALRGIDSKSARSVETLRDNFTASKEYIARLDAELGSRIISPHFNERLASARVLMREIVDSTLPPHEKDVRLMYVMALLMPKTNNHQHLKGSVPKETLLALAKRHGLDDVAKARLLKAYEAGSQGFPDLDAFNKAYGIIAYPVRTPTDYRTAIESIIQRANISGQLTCEIRCAVIGQRDDQGNPLDPRAATENIIAGIRKTQQEIGPEAPKIGFTFLGYRGRDWKPEEVLEHAQLAIEFAQKYPSMRFSFDIAGPEDTGYSPEYFENEFGIFSLLKTHNEAVASRKVPGEPVGITIHSGETPEYDKPEGSTEGKPGYEAIKEAIRLGVMRIGHGVQAVKDPETLDLLKQHNITVEICGCCNVNTIPINTEGMAMHPLEEFLKRGIKVTLCTDNDTICDTGITGEYGLFLLSGHGQLMNWNTVKNVVVDGIRSSFISKAEQQAAIATYASRIREIERLYREVVIADVDDLNTRIISEENTPRVQLAA